MLSLLLSLSVQEFRQSFNLCGPGWGAGEWTKLGKAWRAWQDQSHDQGGGTGCEIQT